MATADVDLHRCQHCAGQPTHTDRTCASTCAMDMNMNMNMHNWHNTVQDTRHSGTCASEQSHMRQVGTGRLGNKHHTVQCAAMAPHRGMHDMQQLLTFLRISSVPLMAAVHHITQERHGTRIASHRIAWCDATCIAGRVALTCHMLIVHLLFFRQHVFHHGTCLTSPHANMDATRAHHHRRCTQVTQPSSAIHASSSTSMRTSQAHAHKHAHKLRAYLRSWSTICLNGLFSLRS